MTFRYDPLFGICNSKEVQVKGPSGLVQASVKK